MLRFILITSPLEGNKAPDFLVLHKMKSFAGRSAYATCKQGLINSLTFHITLGHTTPRARKQIYYSVVYLHSNCCQTTWGATHQSSIQPLMNAQATIRIISGLRKYDHTNESFKKWTLEAYCFFFSFFFFFCMRTLHLQVAKITSWQPFQFPSQSKEHFKELSSPPDAPDSILSPNPEFFFLYHGVNVWNSPPASIRSIDNMNTFKTKAKRTFAVLLMMCFLPWVCSLN